MCPLFCVPLLHISVSLILVNLCLQEFVIVCVINACCFELSFHFAMGAVIAICITNLFSYTSYTCFALICICTVCSYPTATLVFIFILGFFHM